MLFDLRNRRNPPLISRIVAAQERGKAWYSTGREGAARNTVQIQMMRNAQVPVMVQRAGYSACPLPRRTPDGTS